MMTIPVNPLDMLIQSFSEQKAKRCRLLNLRDYLICSLFINPHSKNLVVVFGGEDERNNADALMGWLVRSVEQDRSFMHLAPKEVEAKLLRLLSDQLGVWQD